MLESMRRGAQTWIAKLLFAILMFSFAIWGVADVFTGWGRGSVATVGGTKIPAEDFQRAFQNELDQISRNANKRITAEQGRSLGLDKRVMAQLIGGAAIEAHASQLGLALSDQTLIEGLKSDPDFFGADGKFSKDGFDALLRQANLSERGFLYLRRKDELRAQVLGAFIKAQAVPKPLFDAVHGYRNEKRIIEWLKIDPDAVSVAEPDAAKLTELYETNKSRYMTPEYRKMQVLMLTPDDLKKQITVTDEDIAKSYEATKDSYDTPEQRRVQQIAFKDKAAAEAALKALRDGSKSFGDVAKEAGAKDTDVDLGLVTMRQMIDPVIAAAAFKLEKDTFSDVVAGRFATVIVRVTQIEPGTKRTLADVKGEVRDKLAAERAKDMLQAKHDEVDDARLAGKTLADIASLMKLSFKDIAATDSKGLGPDQKPVMDTPDLMKIISHAFQPDAETSADQSVELTSGGYAWVNVLATEAPKQKTFDEVKDEVKSNHMAGEQKRLLSELARKLAERVNAGEAMTALEAEAKNKVEKTDGITRVTKPQGLSDAVVAQAFAIAKGRASSGATSDGSTEVVFRVDEVFSAAPPTEQEKTTLMKELEADLVNQSLAEYTDALKTRFNASINEAEFRRVLGVAEQQ